MPKVDNPASALLLKSCLAMWLLLCVALDSMAVEFSTIRVAEEDRQSRVYANATDLALLRASLAVIQDIGFQVTEVERSAGLIVALSPLAAGGNQGHSLTVNLVAVHGSGQRFRVRASMARCCNAPTGRDSGAGDYTDFYQDFFNHLRRELFRERSLK
jgi:hypothetical protein